MKPKLSDAALRAEIRSRQKWLAEGCTLMTEDECDVLNQLLREEGKRHQQALAIKHRRRPGEHPPGKLR